MAAALRVLALQRRLREGAGSAATVMGGAGARSGALLLGAATASMERLGPGVRQQSSPGAPPVDPPQSPARPPSELLRQFLSPHLLSAMERHKIDLQRIRESFRKHEGDCGSTEVQIALLTERIRYMGVHLTANKKDKHSRLGLEGMLARRRKLLKYLRRTDWDSYCVVISRLGLRDRVDLQK